LAAVEHEDIYVPSRSQLEARHRQDERRADLHPVSAGLDQRATSPSLVSNLVVSSTQAENDHGSMQPLSELGDLNNTLTYENQAFLSLQENEGHPNEGFGPIGESGTSKTPVP